MTGAAGSAWPDAQIEVALKFSFVLPKIILITVSYTPHAFSSKNDRRGWTCHAMQKNVREGLSESACS